MEPTSFEVFERDARADGFDEVTQRTWQPDTVLPEHTHPFDVYAAIIQGELWLSCGGNTRHIAPGETFSLPKDTPHSERYGSQGANYWVARRH
jgi:quercetin dioxygenase-like cupin family protein